MKVKMDFDKWIKIIWAVIVAAFALGGWSASMQNQLSELEPKVEKIDSIHNDQATIKGDIGVIKNDVSWIKQALGKK